MSGPKIPSLLLTVDEVAVALRISKSYAKKLVAAGEVRSVKVGRCRRIRTEDLSAYVAQLVVDEGSGADGTDSTGG